MTNKPTNEPKSEPTAPGSRLTTAQDVATLVRRARRDAGLTQAQLAARAGVSRDWVVRMEKGNPRLELTLVLDVLTALGLELTASPRHETEDADPFAGLVLGVPVASPPNDGGR